MRPAEFSPEEIVAAGEALVAAGRNVTGFALRQKVGGGNPNRLKQVWDEHFEDLSGNNPTSRIAHIIERRSGSSWSLVS